MHNNNDNNNAIDQLITRLRRYLDLRTISVTVSVNSPNIIRAEIRQKLELLGFTNSHIHALVTRGNRPNEITKDVISMLEQAKNLGLSCDEIVARVIHVEIAPKKIQAGITIAKAWCNYRERQKNFYNLAADSIFLIENKQYSPICPISLEVMRNPQILTTFQSGHEYTHVVDESSIKAWFKRSKTNPFNKISCSEANLADFPELKQAIEEKCMSQKPKRLKLDV